MIMDFTLLLIASISDWNKNLPLAFSIIGWISLENITNILEVAFTVHSTLLFQTLYSYKLNTVLIFPHRKIICKDNSYIDIFPISYVQLS